MHVCNTLFATVSKNTWGIENLSQKVPSQAIEKNLSVNLDCTKLWKQAEKQGFSHYYILILILIPVSNKGSKQQ